MLIDNSIKALLSFVCWFLLVNSSISTIPNCLDLISHCNFNIQQSGTSNFSYSLGVNATEALNIGGNNVCERVIFTTISNCRNFENGTCEYQRLHQDTLTCGLNFYKLKGEFSTQCRAEFLHAKGSQT